MYLHFNHEFTNCNVCVTLADWDCHVLVPFVLLFPKTFELLAFPALR